MWWDGGMLPGLVPPTDARALLFDCDGTLVETQSLYRMCWRQVFGRHGFDMSDEWFAIWAGHSVRPFVLAAFPGIDDDLLHAIADELASAADLARGKESGVPVVIVRGFPLEGDGSARDLVMPRERSLFD